MTKTALYLFAFMFSISIFAGDTTTIRIHDHTDMTWYGNYDKWGALPDASKEYQKVYLHYTMGCATGGCSDWDYTSQIFVRHRTGEIDSTLNTTPTFTVNGSTQDTVFFSYSPVYIYSWDSINNVLDSITSDTLTIIQFNDPNNPTTATGTLIAFSSNMNVFTFDSLGIIFDSTYFSADTSWIVNYYNWNTPYDVIENYELARVITPYGSGLANNWEFTHVFDITDFVQILRDSVEIRCHYSGWSSGFSATLDFEFIEGFPPRNIVSVENIYRGGYSYPSSTDFEANKLVPKKLFIDPNSSGAMIKMTSTGHGFDNTINAAEFNPINYYLNIDGAQTHSQYNWDADCGENPIYPQGGTWIYDRANWCPGKRAQAFDHEISPYINPGDSIEVNIDFDNFTWGPHLGTCPVQGGICYNGGLGQTPSYTIECQLFQYEGANFSNAAEIIDIIKPSLKDEHSRKNPICGKPLIKIRNYGSTPLTALEIEYRVLGGATNTYSWTGNLAFLASEEVELPNLNSWAGSNNIFEVTLKDPNGQTDEYDANNSMQSEFETVPEYPENFVLWFNTNNGIIGGVSESSWEFNDQNGSVFLASGGLNPNTQFKDTLSFSPGCYSFIVNDTDEDGLDFWANNDGGGMVRFREIGASWLKSFNPDFGTNIVHQFTIGYGQSTTIQNKVENWNLYPNPTNDKFIIEGLSEGETQIVINDNLGKPVFNINILQTGFFTKDIDISHLENGIYIIQISNNTTTTTKKIVKQ